ncbi:SH3 domain-containing protein [Euphorbia peplus]|nr:SH3 domain-containing protein [Euphorbia peplus]
MEAIKKQATRLREQVAKQQQAVLKHLGHFGNESVVLDDAEVQCYQRLQKLYNSTREAKVTNQLSDGGLQCSHYIEILKRLQREAFSDQMKLRDKQDKLERVISYYRTSKGSPFQESSTRLRGDVDVLGAILLLGDVNQDYHDALCRAGIRTGVESKFTFETTVREKDTLFAEFGAGQNGVGYDSKGSGNALSLNKVSYMANVSDWLSLLAVPVGAQSRDFRTISNSSNQRKGLTDLSFAGPPLLHQHNGSTVGLTVRKSNVIASVAQSLSGLGMQENSSNRIGQQHEDVEPLVERNALQSLATGSIALNLEFELDENTKIGGWVEMESSNSKQMRWAVNVFDDSEDEIGWGMCVSGMVEGSSNWSRLQAESYLKLNLGEKLSIKPGIAYAMDGNANTFALMLRSSWSF